MNQTNAKKNTFLLQGSILAVSSILVRLIGLFYRMPMQNIIGDEGMGYYESAQEVYNLIYILSAFSIPLAVSKLMSARLSKKEHKNAYRVFACALLFAFTVGSFACTFLYFGAEFIAVTIIKDPYVVMPLKVLAPTLLVGSLLGVFRGFFQGKKTMMPTALSQILEQIINAIISIFAAYYLMKFHSASDNISEWGAAGGTLGTGLGAMTGLFFLLFVFYLYYPIQQRKIRRDKQRPETYSYLFKILVMTIVPVVCAQIIFRINGVISRIIFGIVLTSKGYLSADISALFGIFSSKYRVLTNVPLAISNALSTAMIPTVVAAITRESFVEAKDKIASCTKFNMLIAIPCTVGMGVLASPILTMLFHDTRVMPARVLQIGVVAVIFYAMSTMSNAVLQSINCMRIPVIHSAIALGLECILLYVLLQFFDLNIYAMVAGNVFLPMVVSILNWRSIKKHLNYTQEVKKTFLIPLACAGIMGVVVHFTYRFLLSICKINQIAVFASIVIGAVIYFLLLIFSKDITEEELSTVPKGRMLIRVAKKLHLM